MTATKAELRTKVLQQIGVLAAGEEPSAEDAAFVDSAIDAFFSELTKFGDPGFTADSISDYAIDSMRDCVALRIAAPFGVAPARFQELATMFSAGWTLLTRHMAPVLPTGTKEDLCNRILVHLGVVKPGEVAPTSLKSVVNDAIESDLAQLARRGLAPFTSNAIPDWAMTPLRDYISLHVAPSLGVQDARLTALIPDSMKALADITFQQRSLIPGRRIKAEYF